MPASSYLVAGVSTFFWEKAPAPLRFSRGCVLSQRIHFHYGQRGVTVVIADVECTTCIPIHNLPGDVGDFEFWVSLSFRNSMNVSDHKQWANFSCGVKSKSRCGCSLRSAHPSAGRVRGRCRSFHRGRIARTFWPSAEQPRWPRSHARIFKKVLGSC